MTDRNSQDSFVASFQILVRWAQLCRLTQFLMSHKLHMPDTQQFHPGRCYVPYLSGKSQPEDASPTSAFIDPFGNVTIRCFAVHDAFERLSWEGLYGDLLTASRTQEGWLLVYQPNTGGAPQEHRVKHNQIEIICALLWAISRDQIDEIEIERADRSPLVSIVNLLTVEDPHNDRIDEHLIQKARRLRHRLGTTDI